MSPGEAPGAPLARWVPATPNPEGGLDALYRLAGFDPGGQGAAVAGAPGRLVEPGLAASLRIFHFNDLHNYLGATGGGVQADPVFARAVGRVRAARAAARVAGEPVLFLSGGDDHTGTVLDELLGSSAADFIADPAYRVYSAAGVDVAAVGNHELDRGAAVLCRGIRADAHFPLVCANLRGSVHLEVDRDYHPALVGIAGGLRIGFLGLITPVDTRTHPAEDPGLAVASPLATLARLLPVVAAASDFVVVLSHCGFGVDRHEGGRGAASRYLAEGDVALARCAAALVDVPLVIVGAHTHTLLNVDGLGADTLVDGVPIVQAGGQGSHLGEFLACFRIGESRTRSTLSARVHRLRNPVPVAGVPATGADAPAQGTLPAGAEARRLRTPATSAVAVAAETVPAADTDFETTCIAPLYARVRERVEAVICTVEPDAGIGAAATRATRYCGECALAGFAADALVARSDGFALGRVELAIVNSTAIGSGIEAGRPSTFRDWYAALPFADTIVIAELRGAQLLAILANNAPRIVRPGELERGEVDLVGYVSRGFLHFSREIRYRIVLGAGAAAATVDSVTVAGVPIDRCLDRVFRVGFTNYLGAGAYAEAWNGQPIGAGVPGAIASFDFRELPQRETGLVLRNEVIARVRAMGRIGAATGAGPDGRLLVAG